MAQGLPDRLPYQDRSQQELIRIYWKQGHIAGFFFDGILNVTHTNELAITSHPIQSGANITDHAYVEPTELNIELMMSDATPEFQKVSKLSEQYYKGNGRTRSIGAFKILKELQKQKRVFDVGTRLETYENMMIASIRVTDNSDTINGLKANITLKQILVANERYIKASARSQTTDNSSNINQTIDSTIECVELEIQNRIRSYSKPTLFRIFNDLSNAEARKQYDSMTEQEKKEWLVAQVEINPEEEFINGDITPTEFDLISRMDALWQQMREGGSGSGANR